MKVIFAESVMGRRSTTRPEAEDAAAAPNTSSLSSPPPPHLPDAALRPAVSPAPCRLIVPPTPDAIMIIISRRAQECYVRGLRKGKESPDLSEILHGFD